MDLQGLVLREGSPTQRLKSIARSGLNDLDAESRRIDCPPTYSASAGAPTGDDGPSVIDFLAGSSPRAFSNPPQGTSHECHDRPAAQHPHEVRGDRQEGHGSRESPGPEMNRDDIRILNCKHTDRSEESQENDGLNESHGNPLSEKVDRTFNLIT